MPRYRVIGYYRDNGQIYDGNAEGDDPDAAVIGLRDSMQDQERDSLMVVAVLDEDGENMHGGDAVFPIAQWEEVP